METSSMKMTTMLLNTLTRKILLCSSVFAVGLMLTACGGDDVNCGPNTVEDDGTCRPAEGAYSCGAGTTVGPEGNCLVDDAGCGPNLVFNESAQRCVPDREECRDGTEFDPESGLCEAAVGCGDGTNLESGVCQPDTGALCGGGAVQFDAESERCVVATGACGDGTQLSAQGECVADVQACGAGLALSSDGECVPTDDVCDEGTTFDADQQLCLPSTRCQQGDVVLNADTGPGICVSPAEQLAETADVQEQENPGPSHNDPTLNGSPLDLGTIDQSSEVSLTGTIAEPSDRDGDGTVDQDRDGFIFEANAGTWVEFSVQSLGLPAPWFVVRGPNGFERQSPIGRDAARQLALPYDGTYTILIAPEAAAASIDEDDGPYGSDDWSYVAELSGIQPPVGNAISLGTGSGANQMGRFPALDDNLYQLDGFSNGDVVEVTASDVGADATGILQIWADGTTLARTSRIREGDTVTTTIPSGSAPLALVDWQSLEGTDDSYTLDVSAAGNAEDLGTLSGGNTTTSSTRTIGANNTFKYAVELPADHVLELSHQNGDDEPLTYSVRNGIEQPLVRENDLPASPNINSAGEDDEGYVWIDEAGLYVIQIESDDQLTDHQLELETHSPTTAGAGTPGDSLTASVSSPTGQYRSEWFLFETQQAASVAASIQASVSSGDSVDFDAAIFDVKRRPYDLADGEGELTFDRGTDSLDVDPTGVTTGRYLVRVGLEDIIDNVDLTVDLTSPPPLEDEPNNDASTATALSAGDELLGEIRGAGLTTRDPSDIAALADTDRFTVNLSSQLGSETTGVIRVDAESNAEDAWSCTLTSPSGNTVDAASNRDAGCLLHLPGDSTGDYEVSISMDAPEWRRYTISYAERNGVFGAEPNDTSDDAVGLPLTTQAPAQFGVGRISTADPIDRFTATIPNNVGSSPELVTRLEMTGPDPATSAQVQVLDGSGNEVGLVQAGELFVLDTSEGDDYEFAVTNSPGNALTGVDGSYRLQILAYEPDISATSSPAASIPDSQPSGGLDTLNVSQSCASVSRVTLDVSVSGHPARTFMSVMLENPSGTTQTLLTPVSDPTNHVFEPLSGNIPFDYPPDNPIDVFNGASGQGDWTVSIVDSSIPFDGTLDEWTLNLNCQ